MLCRWDDAPIFCHRTTILQLIQKLWWKSMVMKSVSKTENKIYWKSYEIYRIIEKEIRSLDDITSRKDDERKDSIGTKGR